MVVKMIKRMNPKIILLLITTIAVLTSSCEEEQQSTPPSVPRLVAKSVDTARAIRGIQPSVIRESPRGGLRLEWFQNPERNLGGYEVWRTEQAIDGVPVNFSLRQKLPLGSQSAQNLPDTVFIDESVRNGTMFYYKLIAYSRLDAASDFSEEFQQYELRVPGIADAPRGDLPMPTDSTLTFRWIDNNQSQGFYCVKVYVEDLDFREENCVAIATGQTFLPNDAVRIDFSRIQTTFPGTTGTKVFRPLERGRRYFWFVMFHPLGFEANVGAPSNRQTFFINP
jgi:hypothetical protein